MVDPGIVMFCSSGQLTIIDKQNGRWKVVMDEAVRWIMVEGEKEMQAKV